MRWPTLTDRRTRTDGPEEVIAARSPATSRFSQPAGRGDSNPRWTERPIQVRLKSAKSPTAIWSMTARSRRCRGCGHVGALCRRPRTPHAQRRDVGTCDRDDDFPFPGRRGKLDGLQPTPYPPLRLVLSGSEVGVDAGDYSLARVSARAAKAVLLFGQGLRCRALAHRRARPSG